MEGRPGGKKHGAGRRVMIPTKRRYRNPFGISKTHRVNLVVGDIQLSPCVTARHAELNPKVVVFSTHDPNCLWLLEKWAPQPMPKIRTNARTPNGRMTPIFPHSLAKEERHRGGVGHPGDPIRWQVWKECLHEPR
jgi:hypothetical protein